MPKKIEIDGVQHAAEDVLLGFITRIIDKGSQVPGDIHAEAVTLKDALEAAGVKHDED
jgi:hypothetical protein